MRKLIARSAVAVSASGLLFISGFEGRELTAYQDAVNVWTICDGRTKYVRPGDTATNAQCDQYLKEDTSEAGQAVLRLIQADLTQDQYDSLVSFTYNLGQGALARSTLRKKLNAGDCKGAGREFLKWDYAGGKRLRGLTKRRVAESTKFTKDCP